MVLLSDESLRMEQREGAEPGQDEQPEEREACRVGPAIAPVSRSCAVRWCPSRAQKTRIEPFGIWVLQRPSSEQTLQHPVVGCKFLASATT